MLKLLHAAELFRDCMLWAKLLWQNKDTTDLLLLDIASFSLGYGSELIEDVYNRNN